MHGTFEKLGKSVENIYEKWSIGFFALPVVLAIAFIGLALLHPKASNWISEAAQAEFVGNQPPTAVTPTQVAQPGANTHTVRAN